MTSERESHTSPAPRAPCPERLLTGPAERLLISRSESGERRRRRAGAAQEVRA